MRPSTALLVVATAVLALSVADATVETTCKEAAAKEKQVNYKFCVSELGKHHLSPGADTWGLAKIAANMGVNNAYGAIKDIEGLQAKPRTDARTKVALGQCHDLYDGMKFAFAGAYDEINARNYTAGKEEAAKAVSQAHQCDDDFMKAGIMSPLSQRSSYSVQIAIVCTAITNLIN
ncbi:pectinesterase inhibitor 8 [Lolium perenne]|uniref:pectinesterase inhibitor 8 n=1 Tax=Lolium perenne TaxID=4522 RepID=UPI0021EAFA54|nr:pectinesterase inhibitor 8-like [Lolium perenne]